MRPRPPSYYRPPQGLSGFEMAVIFPARLRPRGAVRTAE